jgi:hypothetical protein
MTKPSFHHMMQLVQEQVLEQVKVLQVQEQVLLVQVLQVLEQLG